MLRFTSRLAACAAISAAAPALAHQSHGDELPLCTSTTSQTECLLAMENPGFDDEGVFASWTVNPFKPDAVRRLNEANPKIALQPGGSILQIVPLPDVADTGKADAYFLPALFARSSQGEARLRMTLQLIDGASTRTLFSRVYVAGEAWSRPSGGFDIVGASPSAALAVHISRADADPEVSLIVDDVQIVRQR